MTHIQLLQHLTCKGQSILDGLQCKKLPVLGSKKTYWLRSWDLRKGLWLWKRHIWRSAPEKVYVHTHLTTSPLMVPTHPVSNWYTHKRLQPHTGLEQQICTENKTNFHRFTAAGSRNAYGKPEEARLLSPSNIVLGTLATCRGKGKDAYIQKPSLSLSRLENGNM